MGGVGNFSKLGDTNELQWVEKNWKFGNWLLTIRDGRARKILSVACIIKKKLSIIYAFFFFKRLLYLASTVYSSCLHFMIYNNVFPYLMLVMDKLPFESQCVALLVLYLKENCKSFTMSLSTPFTWPVGLSLNNQ